MAGALRVGVCLLACWAGALLVSAQAARAVINDTDGDGPTDGPCALSAYAFELEGNLVVVGIPFSGSAVRIDATTAKLVGNKATAARVCETLLFQIPRFRWSVVSAPPGQAATISNANTLSPSVNVAGPGAYRIRLTACPGGCRLTRGGRSISVGTRTREVTINAVSEFTPPPETEALPPALSPPPGDWFGPRAAPPTFSQSQRRRACQGGGGVKDPQWVTAERFRGAGNYRIVEGVVHSSHIASSDDFLNHDSQDHVWHVTPDPPFSELKQPFSRREMEMELETNHLPREFRPTGGDRTATIGYWIFDCGHEFQTEIHPAVGLAVQRPRQIQIPSSFRPSGFPNGLGSNVVVPGIVTDIIFNRRSGEITNNCSTTGLHQPPVTTTVNGVSVTTDGPCIREPHRVNRSFTFNVYLPRDPQLRARDLGLSPPPVPLFVGQQTIGPGGGPSPSVVVRQDPASGATWLEVTVNLSSFTGTAYARRISAAWAYPQPQNWGARRWRVRLDNMRIVEDAEPDNPGPDIDQGDWRMFFNTNNRDREWTKILGCNDCIDEGDTRRFNYQTGGPELGPDPVLFPGQTIFVHTTGFDDEVFGDDTGTVFVRMPQRNVSNVTAFSHGGSGSYRLNFSIRQGAPVGGATLTPEASALMSAYTLRSRPQCLLAQAQPTKRLRQVRPPLCGAAARDPNLVQTWHPDNVVLRRRVSRALSLGVFKMGEVEQHTIQGISVARLRRMFDSMRPAERGRVLDEIRQELRAVPIRLRGDYDELVATLDRALPRSLVARALPPGFRRSVRGSPLLGR